MWILRLLVSFIYVSHISFVSELLDKLASPTATELLGWEMLMASSSCQGAAEARRGDF